MRHINLCLHVVVRVCIINYYTKDVRTYYNICKFLLTDNEFSRWQVLINLCLPKNSVNFNITYNENLFKQVEDLYHNVEIMKII